MIEELLLETKVKYRWNVKWRSSADSIELETSLYETEVMTRNEAKKLFEERFPERTVASIHGAGWTKETKEKV